MLDHQHAHSDASSMRIGIAVSRYHRDITAAMLADASETFIQAGGEIDRLEVFDAPGAWELTAVCWAMAVRGQEAGSEPFDAIVALGCILTGETPHDQYLAQSLTQGLTAITVQTGVPVAFGVLTCRNLAQAQERASGPAGKGAEAMRAALAVATTLRMIAGDEGVTQPAYLHREGRRG